jgi:hypothetical protein
VPAVLRTIAAALIATALVAAPAAQSAAEKPIATITRRGGLCLARTECKQVLRITRTTISGEGYFPRRLRPADRTALLRAIAALDVKRLRPFRDTCPTAYDARESVYRFRGVANALPSCTYDLKRVKAVVVTERLLATLEPRA